MFTAKDARKTMENDLDERIKYAVENNNYIHNGAYMQVYSEDRWKDIIVQELEKRGFIDIEYDPYFVMSTDVYFKWPVDEEE